MTHAWQRSEGIGPECPDFESLSCFADGELEPARAAVIEAHLGTCARCAGLSARLGVGFAAGHVRRTGGLRTDCLDEETLVAYALRDGADRGSITAHLGDCDGCVIALTSLHKRLGAMAAADVTVPLDVQERARRALDAAIVELAPSPARPAMARVAFLDRWRQALRVPVLVPAALAAGALFMVALHAPMRTGPTAGGEQSRAVMPDAAKMRVTAVEAPVHSRPSRQSEIVGTVRRGAMVVVAGSERDWYEVHPDGIAAGWVEREAFE